MPLLIQGQSAPDFSLFDHNNKQHCLSDYRHQWLVLFFYPKDNTSGCTIEACRLRDDYSELLALNLTVLGVNTDSIKSHQKFVNKYQLPFPLLSDKKGLVSKNYGVLLNLGFIKISKRQSFIISPSGNIAKIYRKVIPQQHSQQIMADIKVLQA